MTLGQAAKIRAYDFQSHWNETVSPEETVKASVTLMEAGFIGLTEFTATHIFQYPITVLSGQ